MKKTITVDVEDLADIRAHLREMDELIKAMTAVLLQPLPKQPGGTVWRLTLECGHLRLDGPWDPAGRQRYMVGDMSVCEICPRRDAPTGRTMLVRQVVNVECVPDGQYREPPPTAAAERREGLTHQG